MIIIIIIIMHDIPYHYNDIPIFAAAPEVTMDQQWRSAQDGAVQVKIDCTVHSNPPSQVIMMMTMVIMMVVVVVLMMMTMIDLFNNYDAARQCSIGCPTLMVVLNR